MGDLSKIVFSQKLLSNKLCIIMGTAGTLFMKTHFLLDLNGQIKVTISETSIYGHSRPNLPYYCHL